MRRYGCTARTIGALFAVTLLLPTALLRAQTQTLFEIRYEPASVSALENTGSAPVNIVVDLVNSPPTVVNDQFIFHRPIGSEGCTYASTELGISSVLANDNDPDGDSLLAFQVGSLNGLTLSQDGTFEYAEGKCAGRESFEYYAWDGFFSSDTNATVDLVLNTIPRASASPDDIGYSGTTTADVAMNGSFSYDSDGDTLRYDWDFGDGSSHDTTSGETTSHRYAAEGNYVVTLTVTDQWGAEDTDTADVVINDTIILSPTSSSTRVPSNTRQQSVVRLSSPQLASTTNAAEDALMTAMARAPRPLATARRYPGASQRVDRRLTGAHSVAPPHPSSPMRSQSTSTPKGLRIFRANYAVTAGTATSGADFIEIPDTEITWDQNDAFPLTFSFDVTLQDDMLAEGDETVQLTLSTKEPEARVLTPTGTLTITDDDPLGGAGFDNATYQAEEKNQSVTITVLLDGDTPPNGGSVEYAAQAGTATAGQDFQTVSGTLTWPEGDTAPKTFEVQILPDNLSEGDETIELTLSKPSGIQLGSPARAVLTITDNDVLGGGGFGSSTFTVDERSQSAEIAVALGGETPPDGGSITYSAEAGTATAGQDFQPVSGTLTWPAGDSSPKTFEVPILNDDLTEGDETIELTLSDPQGVKLGSPSRAVLTIQDDDELGTVQFRRSSFKDSEDSGAATILVDLTGSMSQSASVQYTVASGSAVAGKDFTAGQGTLEWEIGTEGTKTFTVEILEDNLFEEDETITLTLQNPIGISLGSPSNANLLILDNDKPVGVQIEGGDGQSGKAGTELDEPLVVRAFNAQGEPVRGSKVNWEVTTGEGEFLEDDETKTDGEGLASNRLRLGNKLGEVQVTVTVPATKESAVFNLMSELRLGELNLSATERPVAEVLDEICSGDNPGGMQSTCDDLAGLSEEDQQKALRELAPDEIYGQGDMALAMMRVQEVTLRYRLTELRQNRRRSLNNLALNLHGIPVPVQALADSFSLEQLENFDPADPTATQHRGGGASADETTGNLDQPDEIDAGNEEEDWLDKRLGFFLSGTLAVGDRPTVEQEIGLELETTGLTVGVDYKFTNKLVWGGALGYMSNDGDIKNSGGSLDSSGFALSTYLLLMPADRFYLDVVASYGDIDFESERVIDFPGNRQVARADPAGNQGLFALGGGYDLSKGASSLNFFGRGSYLDIDIDPYTEQNAPGMQLAVTGQSLESLLGTAGLEYFYNGSMNWGVLTPSVRLAYNHEFKNDLRFITAQFADDPQSLSFSIATAEPDRDFFTAGLSLAATLPRGISAFATYDNDFSRDDFSFYLITAGFRLELR